MPALPRLALLAAAPPPSPLCFDKTARICKATDLSVVRLRSAGLKDIFRPFLIGCLVEVAAGRPLGTDFGPCSPSD